MKRILIVEDEGFIADLERDYLAIEGYDVLIANEGKTGLELALNEDVDLIILDLMLPGINGFDICRKVRDEKNVPIIIVSAKSEDIDKIRGLGLGADDYMTKPFSPQELVARVKSHLRRYDALVGSKPVTKDFEIGRLRIEKESRRVYLSDSEVIMTNKEFDTLYLLATNPNVVFSKTQLFEKIWGLDSIGDISTVAVHIRRIREKIEIDPANPEYIETVWGAGYRFMKI